MSEDNWIKVLSEIDKTKGKEKPLLVNNNVYDFNIYGIKKRMVGYMIVWNVKSLKAIHISRMEIREGVPFYEMDAETAPDPPKGLIFQSF
jgi:hypothetical protein